MSKKLKNDDVKKRKAKNFALLIILIILVLIFYIITFIVGIFVLFSGRIFRLTEPAARPFGTRKFAPTPVWKTMAGLGHDHRS